MSINLHTREGWDDLRRILDDRAADILGRLQLDMPKRGGVIVIDDPRQSGHGNFAIWLKADGLSWKNFTSGDKGRMLELIAYIKGWYHLDKRGYKEAANWAIDALGLGRVSREQLQRDRANAQTAQVKAQAKQDEELRRKQGAAFYTFTRESVPILGAHGEGTGAEIYLREARGIDLRAVPFLGPRGGLIAPAALRFKARHKYVHRDKKGRTYAESWHPCMIACCVDAGMKIRAIHQTYLRDDFSDKADIPPAPDGQSQPARKVWPDSAGLVIPLWRGEGNFSPADAHRFGLVQTFVFTEGVEDGLTAVLAAPEFRTWGMISLSNMVNVAGRLPPCCDAAIIHRQNDWDKPQAVKQFDAGLAAFRASGRAVAELAAPVGKDINDTLRGAA
ncbi:hypothetical protein ASC80_01655 [Afipia sp. Root123D2]|uniref:DUF7146 domain-containing protein n=1 Tax=Afipia sp. Root123D2 TaxID=1736436 RepID=UPI0006F77948|nr:hypothetical protein [Afipia sp. Root123D2]KQW22128.1 hypothetical protein ASC80_01655 [Afipia sp. Root123D2]